MTNVAVRLPDALLRTLDELVRQGRYPNRTAAVREALEHLVREERRRATDEAIVDGYERKPAAPPDAATRALAERSVKEEPW